MTDVISIEILLQAPNLWKLPNFCEILITSKVTDVSFFQLLIL